MRLGAEPASPAYNLSASVVVPPVLKADPGNAWAVTQALFDTLAGYANNVMTERWLGKLAAVNVYGFSNANTMLESVLIDFGILGPFAGSL